MKTELILRLFLFFFLSFLAILFLFLFEMSLWFILPLVLLFAYLTLKDFRGPFATVLMYHGVSFYPENYPWPQLVCHTELFERFLGMLNKAGFECLNLDDFYAYKSGQKRLKKKSCVLTFDDGFLDNWVFAAPLLKKHAWQGTVFVSQDFIQKDNAVRTRFDEVNYFSEKGKQLEHLNYCSEKELQLLDEEGILKVEAHAKSHSFLFSSNQIIGYYKQTEIDPFLEWNQNEIQKPYWMTSSARQVPIGAPVFEHLPSCANERCYKPDESANIQIAQYIQSIHKEENESFNPARVQQILEENPGKYETDEERHDRFEKELKGVKDWLEQLLNREIHYLAWPHGGISKLGIKKALKYYRLFQRAGGDIRNRPSDPKSEMVRIGGLALKGSSWQQYFLLFSIRSKMEMACGNYYWIFVFATIKILEKLKVWTKPSFQAQRAQHYNFDLISK